MVHSQLAPQVRTIEQCAQEMSLSDHKAMDCGSGTDGRSCVLVSFVISYIINHQNHKKGAKLDDKKLAHYIEIALE
jgi:hypothetical protein